MTSDNYADLLACYRSGQMSDQQLQQHMTADPLFRIYVFEALKRPHGEPAE